ncbi:hypothetical protein TNCV_535171 [Trichonephila clavipes]|nr:hypothetical protein TNCV_535171 [Trichonephila clavipes]
MLSFSEAEFNRSTASEDLFPDAPSVNYIDRFDLSLSKTLSFSKAEFTQLLDRSFYVDDLIFRGNELEKAFQTSRKSKNIIEAAGMDLRKRITNDAILMERWKKENFDKYHVHETMMLSCIAFATPAKKHIADRSVPSRTIAQHIESVTHHSVYARTIRHRLQQSGLSARRPLLGLPLT